MKANARAFLNLRAILSVANNRGLLVGKLQSDLVFTPCQKFNFNERRIGLRFERTIFQPRLFWGKTVVTSRIVCDPKSSGAFIFADVVDQLARRFMYLAFQQRHIKLLDGMFPKLNVQPSCTFGRFGENNDA